LDNLVQIASSAPAKSAPAKVRAWKEVKSFQLRITSVQWRIAPCGKNSP